ncbi:carboxypeptidase-like regulatory domain-containing protein [Flavobacteriaceae bacterium KMM 6897]|nr:carboxypeptidase-like regulatory domain-containing protein [Flavobacteriaceae bacterium KMM 6897]MEB8347077.1 carboxypeptidase-like regulatory domain-containing protein [Flavobacteriaceae bacterium KMM 6898]
MFRYTFIFARKALLMAIIALCFIGIHDNVYANILFQEDQEINYNSFSGEVLDSDSKKPLVFATLTLEGTNISTVTNTEGTFSLKIPKNTVQGNINISFLGYKTKTVALTDLRPEKNEIMMDMSSIELSEVNLTVPKSAEGLVRETLANKGENYFSDPTIMTAFYRETIKKRRKNVSLSEAVVTIYKAPYNTPKRDAVQLYKARKSTDYSRLDTVALKLEGGPFNTLYVDIMKYPEYIFTNEDIPKYNFSFDQSTRVNDRLIYVVNFEQHSYINEPLYKGKLYIDSQNKILTSAIYTLNITDVNMAARLFVRKKPANANVWPTDVAYRVDYREKDGKWHYGYSNVLMEFKINWDDRFFNSVYSMTAEMAVTDWETNTEKAHLKAREKMKSRIILSDEASGFSDPDFWGEYNIIEPEKSIESAIRKIQRQLKRSRSKELTSAF